MTNVILEELLNENSITKRIKTIRNSLKSATNGKPVLLSNAKKMPIWDKKDFKLLDSLFQIQGIKLDDGDYSLSF